MEKLYTTEEIAELLLLHRETVMRYIREKKLKSIKIGKRYFVKQAHFDEFIKG